jgi:hypothetical protein
MLPLSYIPLFSNNSMAVSQQAAFVTSIQNFHLQSVETFQIEAIKEAFFCLSTK